MTAPAAYVRISRPDERKVALVFLLSDEADEPECFCDDPDEHDDACYWSEP